MPVITYPRTRGSLREGASLAATTWFGVGGPADALYKPADREDLADFLRALDPAIPVTPLGVGSNVIARDGGIRGVVVRLGRGFNYARIEDGHAISGAATLDLNLARYAADQGAGGLEFLSGIPGTVGGALAMNAGAYGREVREVLIQATAVSRRGEILSLSLGDMRYAYRHYGGPEGLIFTEAIFAVTPDAPAAIHARIAQIQAQREATQPIRERTGGSTFKNPPGEKAWELIDAAGCRGLRRGGAQISPLHCNFLINTGDATAADLEALGEEVIARVRDHSGVTLGWEVQRLGDAAADR